MYLAEYIVSNIWCQKWDFELETQALKFRTVKEQDFKLGKIRKNGYIIASRKRNNRSTKKEMRSKRSMRSII